MKPSFAASLYGYMGGLGGARLTWYVSMVEMRKVKEMAVAAMAWVDGIPYSAITLFSSLTTGGEKGRGHFRMSLATWPIYITNCKTKGLR